MVRQHSIGRMRRHALSSLFFIFPNHGSPTVMGKVSVDDAIGRFSHDEYYLSFSDNNILKISTLSFSVRSLVDVVPAVVKKQKNSCGKAL